MRGVSVIGIGSTQFGKHKETAKDALAVTEGLVEQGPG